MRGCVSRELTAVGPSAGCSNSHTVRPLRRSSALTTNVTRLSPGRRTGSERLLPRLERVAALHEARTGPHFAAACLRGHEHEIAPHDRRGDAEAAQLRLPRDVLGVAPALGQSRFARDAGRRRTAPLRPVLRVDACDERGKQSYSEQHSESHESRAPLPYF